MESELHSYSKAQGQHLAATYAGLTGSPGGSKRAFQVTGSHGAYVWLMRYGLSRGKWQPYSSCIRLRFVSFGRKIAHSWPLFEWRILRQISNHKHEDD